MGTVTSNARGWGAHVITLSVPRDLSLTTCLLGMHALCQRDLVICYNMLRDDQFLSPLAGERSSLLCQILTDTSRYIATLLAYHTTHPCTYIISQIKISWSPYTQERLDTYKSGSAWLVCSESINMVEYVTSIHSHGEQMYIPSLFTSASKSRYWHFLPFLRKFP